MKTGLRQKLTQSVELERDRERRLIHERVATDERRLVRPTHRFIPDSPISTRTCKSKPIDPNDFSDTEIFVVRVGEPGHEYSIGKDIKKRKPDGSVKTSHEIEAEIEIFAHHQRTVTQTQKCVFSEIEGKTMIDISSGTASLLSLVVRLCSVQYRVSEKYVSTASTEDYHCE